MDGEAQPVATHIYAMDTPLDHTHDEAIPLMECTRTPIGNAGPRKSKLHNSVNYTP